jgi:hypothetical protein
MPDFTHSLSNLHSLCFSFPPSFPSFGSAQLKLILIFLHLNSRSNCVHCFSSHIHTHALLPLILNFMTFTFSWRWQAASCHYQVITVLQQWVYGVLLQYVWRQITILKARSLQGNKKRFLITNWIENKFHWILISFSRLFYKS